MAVTLGGSLGITYPDASTTAPAGINSRFSPFITNTSNVLSLQGVKVDGSVGVYTPTQLATTSSVTANIVITTNTTNYVLDTSKVPGYVAGITSVTVTINSGVFVSSASTGSAAFRIDSSWASGDTLTVINNGSILGMGGAGGPGNSGAGFSAGPALNTSFAVAVNNTNGTIAGGGGGGGAGALRPDEAFEYGGGGGGGGRTGLINSLGGPGGNAAGAGGNGTNLAAGGGGGGAFGVGAPGGSGGNWGSAGGGGGATFGGPGGPGGAAGAAVIGNSNITWNGFGTRFGAIS